MNAFLASEGGLLPLKTCWQVRFAVFRLRPRDIGHAVFNAVAASLVFVTVRNSPYLLAWK
jgi:hypothetical protein